MLKFLADGSLQLQCAMPIYKVDRSPRQTTKSMNTGSSSYIVNSVSLGSNTVAAEPMSYMELTEADREQEEYTWNAQPSVTKSRSISIHYPSSSAASVLPPVNKVLKKVNKLIDFCIIIKYYLLVLTPMHRSRPGWMV